MWLTVSLTSIVAASGRPSVTRAMITVRMGGIVSLSLPSALASARRSSFLSLVHALSFPRSVTQTHTHTHAHTHTHSLSLQRKDAALSECSRLLLLWRPTAIFLRLCSAALRLRRGLIRHKTPAVMLVFPPALAAALFTATEEEMLETEALRSFSSSRRDIEVRMTTLQLPSFVSMESWAGVADLSAAAERPQRCGNTSRGRSAGVETTHCEITLLPMQRPQLLPQYYTCEWWEEEGVCASIARWRLGGDRAPKSGKRGHKEALAAISLLSLFSFLCCCVCARTDRRTQTECTRFLFTVIHAGFKTKREREPQGKKQGASPSPRGSSPSPPFPFLSFAVLARGSV